MGDIFSEIWNSVRRNKLRTCLTGFAVAWGIFMLIVLLGAGNGLINAILQGSEGVSLNTMTVSGGVTSKPYGGLSEGRSITLEASDMEVFESESLGENVDEVMSSIYYNGTAVFGKNSASSCLVYGVYPGYQGVDGIKISSGSPSTVTNPNPRGCAVNTPTRLSLPARTYLPRAVSSTLPSDIRASSTSFNSSLSLCGTFIR